MHNIRAILKRDLHRLLTVPAAWVILVGLIAIPPLYALVNIVGFWNPYGNTKSIAVAVANEDEGATNAIMGDMNLGKQIVDQLATNDELGWRFMDETQAMDAVRSGTVYAAIVLPKDFSSAMSDMLTGSGTRPQIDYYVNEKANTIAPKITDVGANTIDQTVNSTFVSTVGQVVSNTLNTAIGQGQQTTTQAQQAIVDDITQAKDNVSQLRASIGEIDTAIDQAPAKIDAARQSVATAERVGKDASTALDSSSTLITNATRVPSCCRRHHPVRTSASPPSAAVWSKRSTTSASRSKPAKPSPTPTPRCSANWRRSTTRPSATSSPSSKPTTRTPPTPSTTCPR